MKVAIWLHGLLADKTLWLHCFWLVLLMICGTESYRWYTEGGSRRVPIIAGLGAVMTWVVIWWLSQPILWPLSEVLGL